MNTRTTTSLSLRKLLLIVIIITVFFSCNSRKEDLANSETITDYISLEPNKYITYHVDSTVFVLNGSKQETHSYQVKHRVQSTTQDNEGNTVYIIEKLINNEEGTGEWKGNGTYYITLYKDRVEVTEDNLRVIKLVNPLRMGKTWKGNSHIPFAPYQQLYTELVAGTDMNEWDFTYTGSGTETIAGNSYQNTWTVEQENDISNIPPDAETVYGYKQVGLEKYAKGIGLVYRDFQIYDYQSGSGDFPNPHYTGFGITMWIIDHN